VNRAASSQCRERKAPLPRPSPSPKDHRRRSPPRSSTTTPRIAPSQPPLAKSSLPLGSPAPARAKPPPRGPRTGPPAANCRRAHRRPAFLPCMAGSLVPSTRGAVTPPPSALADGWARSDAVAPARRPRRLPRPWAAAGPALSRAPAPRLAGPRTFPPAHLRRNPFSFFFSSPFSHLISFLQYFMHQKLSK
jgi:hypothetical protein